MWTVARSDLSKAAQLEYDRLKAERERTAALAREAAALAGTVPDPVPTGPGTGQSPLELPPVGGPKWVSDQLAISREWVACRKDSKTPWNVIPYAALSSVRPARGGIEATGGGGERAVISKDALGSLEACSLLVAGMSTNPAVGPAAGELLQPHLEAARRNRAAWLARRHSVNRSGTTHTFHLHRGFAIYSAAFGAGFLGLGIAGLFGPRHPAGWELLALLGGCLTGGAFSVWIGVRSARMGVQISSGILTVRNWFSSYTASCGEISAINLHPKASGTEGFKWVPRVELADGRSGWIDALVSGPAENPPQPEPAALFDEVRALLGARADADPSPEIRSDLQIGEQPQDMLPVWPQVGELMLGAHGLPSLDRPAKGRAYLLAAAFLTCGIVSVAVVVVALKFASPSLSGYLAWLGMLSGILPVSMARSPWNHDQLGRMGHSMLRAGMALGFVAFYGASSVLCPDCTN
jgi:hypothetical protein